MQLSIEETKLKLKEIIVQDLEVNTYPDDIGDEISLYEDGLGLDSISIINFIVLIEQRFDIKFDENDITSKLFSNINSLAEFVYAKNCSKLVDLPTQS